MMSAPPFRLNIFYSGLRYTEKDWVRLKVRHYYPLRKGKEKVQKQENTNMNNTDSTNYEKWRKHKNPPPEK